MDAFYWLSFEMLPCKLQSDLHTCFFQLNTMARHTRTHASKPHIQKLRKKACMPASRRNDLWTSGNLVAGIPVNWVFDSHKKCIKSGYVANHDMSSGREPCATVGELKFA